MRGSGKKGDSTITCKKRAYIRTHLCPLGAEGAAEPGDLGDGAGVEAVEHLPRDELLQAFPRMPATVIGERIGWPYSMRTLSGRVAELRPAYLPPDPAGRMSAYDLICRSPYDLTCRSVSAR